VGHARPEDTNRYDDPGPCALVAYATAGQPRLPRSYPAFRRGAWVWDRFGAGWQLCPLLVAPRARFVL